MKQCDCSPLNELSRGACLACKEQHLVRSASLDKRFCQARTLRNRFHGVESKVFDLRGRKIMIRKTCTETNYPTSDQHVTRTRRSRIAAVTSTNATSVDQKLARVLPQSRYQSINALSASCILRSSDPPLATDKKTNARSCFRTLKSLVDCTGRMF